MPGNPHKGGFWNKPGSVGRHAGRSGSAQGDFFDALTIEDVAMGIGVRKARIKHARSEKRAEDRTAAERRKITLSSPEWLANFMKDAPDET